MRRRSNKVKFETSPSNKRSSVTKSSPNPNKVRSEVQGRSKLFNKLNKNRNCLDKDLYECMSNGIEIVGDFSIIGAGSFGILLRSETRMGYPIAIKTIIKLDTSESGKEFNEMERELAFSYYMGDVGIGPEVLDSFYYNLDRDDFKKYPELRKVILFIIQNIVHKRLQISITEKKRPAEIQFIIMKSYEYDCNQIFEMGNNTYSASTVKQMIELVKKQINLGMYCHDVKPGNFVANISKNGKVDVKMIDFGADFCTEKQIYARHKNDEICKELGVPYTDVLLISNIIQIYIMYAVIANYKTDRSVIRAFFGSPIFQKFYESDWDLFLKKYLIEASRNEMDGLHDPSTQLVHYCNLKDLDGDRKYKYAFDVLHKLLRHAEPVVMHYEKSKGLLKDILNF
jgi:hypothetical protein